jgi:hypothetical protein
MIDKSLLKTFGSRENPLRSSNMTKLKHCPGYLVAAHMFGEFEEDTAFKAAHTGSAFGKAAEIYHRDYDQSEPTESEIADILKATNHVALNGEGEGEGRQDPFQNYDSKKVTDWLKMYCSDPRNHSNSVYGEVIVESLEIPLELVLPPHKIDKTRQEIVITCHLDQVRRHPLLGMPVIWDIKCVERFETTQFINPYYAAQLSVYTKAWEQRFGEKAIMGGVIHPPSYKGFKLVPNPGTDKKKKGKKIRVEKAVHECNVFLQSGFSADTVDAQLDQLRYLIALIRQGDILLNSGPHCSWCYYEHFSNCSATFKV